MLEAQWLQTLGDLTAQLLSVEYSDTPDDAQLLALLKQAHVMYVQIMPYVSATHHDNHTTGCTGPCLYMSSKPNRHTRQWVAAIRRGDDIHNNYTQLVQFVIDNGDNHDEVALCAVTRIPCQRNTNARVAHQMAAEAKYLLHYAQQLVKSRVLELEAQHELQGSLEGGASMKALNEAFQQGHAPALVNQLLTCIPCDDAIRVQVSANVSSVDSVLKPLVAAMPPRMRPNAALVKHAFAKRWRSAASLR